MTVRKIWKKEIKEDKGILFWHPIVMSWKGVSTRMDTYCCRSQDVEKHDSPQLIGTALNDAYNDWSTPGVIRGRSLEPLLTRSALLNKQIWSSSTTGSLWKHTFPILLCEKSSISTFPSLCPTALIFPLSFPSLFNILHFHRSFIHCFLPVTLPFTPASYSLSSRSWPSPSCFLLVFFLFPSFHPLSVWQEGVWGWMHGVGDTVTPSRDEMTDYQCQSERPQCML